MDIDRNRYRFGLLGSSAAAVLVLVAIVLGQEKNKPAGAAGAPQISSVFPPGAQRGTTVPIEIKGKNLAGVAELRFSRSGVHTEKLEAKGADRLQATVSVDPDAELKTIELRALSGDGLSNVKLFRIDDLPQQNETAAKNDTLSDAQPIDYPVAVNGQLSAADIDCYRIHVAKKERLVIEVEAHRLGSPTDARLRLMDAQGRFLTDAATTQAIRPDERIDYTFKTPGDYVIAVEDAEFVGGEGSIYRLRIGSWPYATAMFPIGGRRGESVELRAEGGNLEKPLVQTIALPDDPRRSVMELELASPAGPLRAPMLFALGGDPELFEEEPNGDVRKPQAIQPPVVINGRIGSARDKDRFVFTAKKGEKYTIEVFADRLGSWLDSVLTIATKAGKVLAENDDVGIGPNQPKQQPNVVPPRRATSDSRIDFTAPDNGAYVVTIDDRYNGGGPEYAYRLSVTPAHADFTLYAGAPAAAQKAQAQKNGPPPGPSDVLVLDPGKSASIPVTVERRGYDGKVELRVTGLPDGLSAAPATVAEKQNAGQVTITAQADAAGRTADIEIVGSAEIAGNKVERVVQNAVVLATLDPLHVARRETTTFALAITRHEAPLALKLPASAVLARGLETELRVEIERKAGFSGAVAVSIAKLPAGVTAAKTTIPQGKNEGVVKLTAAPNAAVGTQAIHVESQGKVGNATVESSGDVALAVVKPFELSLELPLKQLDLVIGGSQTLKLAVKRQGEFDGPVELAVRGLPAGVTVRAETVEPDQEEAEITFEVGDDAKPGAATKPIVIEATATVAKQKVKAETAPVPVTLRAAE